MAWLPRVARCAAGGVGHPAAPPQSRATQAAPNEGHGVAAPVVPSGRLPPPPGGAGVLRPLRPSGHLRPAGGGPAAAQQAPGPVQLYAVADRPAPAEQRPHRPPRRTGCPPAGSKRDCRFKGGRRASSNAHLCQHVLVLISHCISRTCDTPACFGCCHCHSHGILYSASLYVDLCFFFQDKNFKKKDRIFHSEKMGGSKDLSFFANCFNAMSSFCPFWMELVKVTS